MGVVGCAAKIQKVIMRCVGLMKVKIMMRIPFVLIALVLFCSQAHAANPFRSFIGSYKVASRVCKSIDESCSRLKEVRIGHLPGDADGMYLSEIFDAYSAQTLLDDHLLIDPQGNKSDARIVGEGTYFASRTHQREWGADAGTTVVSQSVQILGDLIQYSYYYRLLKNADGREIQIERHFTLVRMNEFPIQDDTQLF